MTDPRPTPNRTGTSFVSQSPPPAVTEAIAVPYDYRTQQYWREQSKTATEGRGFKEGELQWLWRTVECFARKYDTGEVVAAVCDALTREGQTAWPGDGTSCVEQMIRLQWERAEKAEQLFREQQEEIERLRSQLELTTARWLSANTEALNSRAALCVADSLVNNTATSYGSEIYHEIRRKYIALRSISTTPGDVEK